MGLPAPIDLIHRPRIESGFTGPAKGFCGIALTCWDSFWSTASTSAAPVSNAVAKTCREGKSVGYPTVGENRQPDVRGSA